MIAKLLHDALRRVETWPEAAQVEPAEIALEIEASLSAGTYQATAKELEGIDRGLKAAREGSFATEEQVSTVLQEYRPKVVRLSE
jgi:predicted transcriptional regulator